MASNGRVGVRSGSPSFLVIGLSLIIIVLLYSYWSVSSRNSMLLRDQSLLQKRWLSLKSLNIVAEKKKSSAMAQIVSIEKTKRQLEGDVVTSSKQKSELNLKKKALEQHLDREKKMVAKLKSEWNKSKAELEKLKGNIEQTSQKVKALTEKANSFVDMHQKLKQLLAKKIDNLLKAQNGWKDCKLKLDILKEHPDLKEDKDAKEDTVLFERNLKENPFLQKEKGQPKKEMKPTALPSQTVKLESRKILPNMNSTQMVRNTTVAKKKTNKVTPSPGKQSGNDMTGKLNDNNTTTADKAMQGNGSTNITSANTKPYNKGSTVKPTTSNVEDESEGDKLEDTQNGGKLEDVDTQNGDENDDHDHDHDDQKGAGARPRGFPPRPDSNF